jgi:mannose-6-phosphate isomerase-like protein (cupin superfamily)
MQVAQLDSLESFTTLDGSTIRELAHTDAQSLAEATVPPGAETIAHLHRASEEIYYFTSGRGRMRLGEDESEVGAGDCVVIAPGTPHKLWAAEGEALVLLCCCSPPYSDDDTEMLESAQNARS